MPLSSAPTEPFVAHLARLPKSLDADLRRISTIEGIPYSRLEREFLATMVALYDAERSVAGGD